MARCTFVALLKLKSLNESILKVSVCSWAQINTGKWFPNKNHCLRLTHNDSTNAGGKPQLNIHICIIFTFLARENRRLNQLWHMTVDDIFNVYLLYYTILKIFHFQATYFPHKNRVPKCPTPTSTTMLVLLTILLQLSVIVRCGGGGGHCTTGVGIQHSVQFVCECARVVQQRRRGRGSVCSAAREVLHGY